MIKKQFTILLVEDNDLNTKFVRQIITSMGCVFLEASDAVKGLAIARKQQPDLILMDINLPGMDGLEATKLLKEDSATCSIPVIAFTALAMKGDREEILSAGCDDYISKPVGYRVLIDKLEEWLQKKTGGMV